MTEYDIFNKKLEALKVMDPELYSMVIILIGGPDSKARFLKTFPPNDYRGCSSADICRKRHYLYCSEEFCFCGLKEVIGNRIGTAQAGEWPGRIGTCDDDLSITDIGLDF